MEPKSKIKAGGILMNVLVIAPHPDDETLGCGGTLLKLKEFCELYWVIVTTAKNAKRYSERFIEKRREEIEKVNRAFGFKKYYEMNYKTSEMYKVDQDDFIEAMSMIIEKIKPEIVFLNHNSDIHTDHQIINKLSLTALKPFKNKFLKKILFYEVLSETEIMNKFKPNVFVDISEYIDRKVEIMNIYRTEVGTYPFPRSEQAIRALAMYRGIQCNSHYAEAFELFWSKEL